MTAGARLQDIVRRLGGDLYDGGRRALVPGPGHGSEDRSVSLLVSGDRIVLHSFAGDDWREVARHLRLGRAGGDAPEPGAAAPALSQPERLACAAALWDTARPVAGTPGAWHARRRGIHRALPEALRFHAGVSSAVYADAGRRRPALLAAIRDPAGRLCGVEVAYLDRSGGPAAMRLPRKIIGLAAGGAVRLDPPGETLLVGEGVFSSLSAGVRFGQPAWALLSVGNLRRWSPPAGVRRVIIAGDRGRPGEAGAAALQARLRELAVAAVVRLPPDPWEDWNAWACGGRTPA